MRRLILGLASAALLALPAAAQPAPSTLPLKDNTGTVRNVAGQADAAGAFHYRDVAEGLTSSGAPDPILTDGAGHWYVHLLDVPTHAVTQSGAWSFGLTGPLPGFASPPTFNLGTLNGAALDSSLQALRTALGSPFQAGAYVGNTDFGARCDVVSADAAFTAGTTQRCQMTSKGRVKVGLSSAAADGAAAAADNDQVGGLGPDGLQHAFRLDGSNRLITAPPTSTPDTLAGDLAATRSNTAADAANNAAAQGEVALTVGAAPVAAGRALKLLCPSTTSLTVTYADGSTGTWSVVGAANDQTLPIAVTAVTAETVACTRRSNLK